MPAFRLLFAEATTRHPRAQPQSYAAISIAGAGCSCMAFGAIFDFELTAAHSAHRPRAVAAVIPSAAKDRSSIVEAPSRTPRVLPFLSVSPLAVSI